MSEFPEVDVAAIVYAPGLGIALTAASGWPLAVDANGFLQRTIASTRNGSEGA